jgi:hypothetical protein
MFFAGVALFLFIDARWGQPGDYEKALTFLAGSFAIAPLVAFAGLFIDGARREELGWRGFATPLLQGRMRAPLHAAFFLACCGGSGILRARFRRCSPAPISRAGPSGNYSWHQCVDESRRLRRLSRNREPLRSACRHRDCHRDRHRVQNRLGARPPPLASRRRTRMGGSSATCHPERSAAQQRVVEGPRQA